EYEEWYSQHGPHDETAQAVALHEVRADHGYEDDLASTRLGEDGAACHEHDRHDEQRRPQEPAALLTQGEGEGKADARRQRELVRILEPAAIPDGTSAHGRRPKQTDVLAQVARAGLGIPVLALLLGLTRAPIRCTRGEVVGVRLVDENALLGRKVLMDADEGD